MPVFLVLVDPTGPEGGFEYATKFDTGELVGKKKPGLAALVVVVVVGQLLVALG
jgi:hypothetical protein